MKKKILFTVVILAFLFLVYSHDNSKDVPLADVEDLLLQQDTITSMEKSGARQLMQFLNLDADTFEEFLYYRGKEALSVDELLIVKVKSADDISIVRDAVEKRIEDQIKTFESYGPKQVASLKSAVVESKGSYIFYCTGEYAEKYKEVFFNVI